MRMRDHLLHQPPGEIRRRLPRRLLHHGIDRLPRRSLRRRPIGLLETRVVPLLDLHVLRHAPIAGALVGPRDRRRRLAQQIRHADPGRLRGADHPRVDRLREPEPDLHLHLWPLVFRHAPIRAAISSADNFFLATTRYRTITRGIVSDDPKLSLQAPLRLAPEINVRVVAAAARRHLKRPAWIREAILAQLAREEAAEARPVMSAEQAALLELCTAAKQRGIDPRKALAEALEASLEAEAQSAAG